MLMFNAIATVLFWGAVAIIACPAAWHLPLLLLEPRWGQRVHDTRSYRFALAIDAFSLLFFALGVGAVVRTQFCRGCSSGLIILPLFAFLAGASWLLHFVSRACRENAYRRQGGRSRTPVDGAAASRHGRPEASRSESSAGVP